MADDTTASAATAGGDSGTAVEEKKPADAGGANLGGADTGGGGRALGGSDTDAAADAGGDDWRSRYGQDPELQKILARLPSEAELAKKLVSQEKLIRSGQHKTIAALPDDATPEEIAAYRKAIGIPDKADGYGLAFPEESKPSDADKAGLAAFQEYALAKNMTPAAAKTAFDFYAQHMAAGQVARDEMAVAANQEAIVELRTEYRGSEFKRNMSIAEDFLAKHFDGEEKALDEVLNAALPNGVKIKNFPPFVKGLVRMARSYADEEALIGGDGAGGGKSIDDEYKDLINKSATPGQKLSAAEEKRVQQLAEARHSRDVKQGRSRAA